MQQLQQLLIPLQQQGLLGLRTVSFYEAPLAALGGPGGGPQALSVSALSLIDLLLCL